MATITNPMNFAALKTHIEDTTMTDLAKEAQNIQLSTQMLQLFVENVKAKPSEYVDAMEKVIVVLPTELMQTKNAQTLLNWLEQSGRFANLESLTSFIFNSTATGNLPLLRKVMSCYDQIVGRGSALALRNDFAESILFTACQYEQVAVAQELMTLGFDVNVSNAFQSTPLHEACMKLNPELVRLLISKGANVNAKDCMGNTPFHQTFPIEYDIARPESGSGLYRTNRVTARKVPYQDSFHIALALINANASFFERDNMGRLPLDNANPIIIATLKNKLDYMRLDLLNFVSLFKEGNDAEIESKLNAWKTRSHYNELRQAAYQMPSLVPILEKFGIPRYIPQN